MGKYKERPWCPKETIKQPGLAREESSTNGCKPSTNKKIEETRSYQREQETPKNSLILVSPHKGQNLKHERLLDKAGR